MTGVPTGAKAAWCMAVISKAAATPVLCVEAATGYTLSDITSGTNYLKYYGINAVVAGSSTLAYIKVHLDSSLQFKWCTNSTNSTVVIGSAIDYEM
jgi:hypothetical protein